MYSDGKITLKLLHTQVLYHRDKNLISRIFRVIYELSFKNR